MRRVFALLLLCAASLARAADAPAPTHWVCALSQDLVRLLCQTITDPRDVAASETEDTTAASPRSSVTAVVNGTRFPLDGARVWTVELWSPPSEPEFVSLLARATICYRSPGCSVQVLPWQQRFSRL